MSLVGAEPTDYRAPVERPTFNTAEVKEPWAAAVTEVITAVESAIVDCT